MEQSGSKRQREMDRVSERRKGKREVEMEWMIGVRSEFRTM